MWKTPGGRLTACALCYLGQGKSCDCEQPGKEREGGEAAGGDGRKETMLLFLKRWLEGD